MTVKLIIFRPEYGISGSDYNAATYAYPSLTQIFFKSSSFYPSVLKQQLTTLDFVSYCGGSLGLFLGFSFLSAAEIIYYFSLRIIFKKIESNKTVGLKAVSLKGKKNQSFVKEIVESSSIHGCNQIVFENRHKAEKYFFDIYD